MYIERILSKELEMLANDYATITVIGPRQSGKSTLVKKTFPNKPHVNLEALDIRGFAKMDPRGFLAQYKDGAIFDEIQRVPELLSYLQELIDAEPERKGTFILTGSHQLELHQAITQSLAGRTAILNLLPLSLQELHLANVDLPLNQYLLNGFYPRIYKENLDPTKAYRNYFQTYIERDVRQLIQLKDLSLFERFLKLCAGRIGQVLVYENIANELGISSHTVQHWLSVLEASFIIIRLKPYFENFGKRIIKSPKLYFTDVGIASYLLDIENESQISRDPLRGHLIENLVILELYKTRFNQGKDPHLYYYRDSQKNEVDVIYKQSHHLIPIEIKAAQTCHHNFFKNLEYFQKLVGDRCPTGYLIYTGEQEQNLKSFHILNFQNTYKIVE